MAGTGKKAGRKSRDSAGRRRTQAASERKRRQAARTGQSAERKPPPGQQESRLPSESAVELLKTDHERVSTLFEDFERAEGEEKQAIAEQVFTELEIHSHIEEEIFYPAFKQKADSDGKELIKEAIQEHQSIKDLIEELRPLDAEDEEFEDKFQELTQQVNQHVEVEEGEILPTAEDILADQLNELGAEMEKRRHELMETAESGAMSSDLS